MSQGSLVRHAGSIRIVDIAMGLSIRFPDQVCAWPTFPRGRPHLFGMQENPILLGFPQRFGVV